MRTTTLSLLVLAGTLTVAPGCHNPVAQAAGNVPPVAASAGGAQPAPFATPPVLAGTADVATLAARVNPAVVNITTVHEMRRPQMGSLPFGFGFGGMNRGGGGGEDEVMKQKALGSGFLVDGAGHVVTNAHVVEGADTVRVKLADDREYEAKVKGKDVRLDLALLELQGAKDLPTPEALGSSGDLRVGEYVVAIGNPFGLGHTVTMGIVSAKGRTIGAGPYDDFIQTDASINPGNSGGPLFNLRGQVVGINTAINPNGKGIGFAIPVDALKDVLAQLATTGHVARGRLGVAIQGVDAPMAKALGLDRAKGALVGEVEPGGPSDKAGLKAGDVIVGVDQTEVPRVEDLPRIVARHAPGSKVSLKVMRDRNARTVDVTLDALKDEPARGESDDDAAPSQQGPASHKLGIEVGDARGGGVAIQRVVPGSVADGALAPGDVIVEVNRAPIAHASELAAKLASTPKDDPILLRVRREGKLRFVALEPR
jgi:serine protease Do